MKSVKSAFRRVLREVGAVFALTVLAGIVFLLILCVFSSREDWSVVKSWAVILSFPLAIGVWQFIFGERKWLRGIVRGIAVLLVSTGIFVFSEMYCPSLVMLPVKMAMGEGMWVKRVGVAEMQIGERNITYDVFDGKMQFASFMPMDGLFLSARQKRDLPDNGLFSDLIACTNSLSDAYGVYRIPLSLPRQPLVCQAAIEIVSYGKIDCVEKFEIVEAGDTLEYRIGVVYYKQTAAGVDETRQSYVLKIPRRFFGSNCQTPFRPAVPARADWDESVDDTGIGD